MLMQGSAMQRRFIPSAQKPKLAISRLSEFPSSSWKDHSGNRRDDSHSAAQVEANHDMSDAASDTDYEDSNDAETGEESPGRMHKCPGCDNLYVNQKSLKVGTSDSTAGLISLIWEQCHLSDRRSV